VKDRNHRRVRRYRARHGLEAAKRDVERELGPIDVWINVAFSNVFGEFLSLRRDCGTIVQVGSAQCYRGIPLQSAYCGGKSAIRGFTDSIRCELAHERSRVRIAMVQMPAVNTPQFSWCRSHMERKVQPVPPIYQPEVAAQAVYWASHHRRRELWVGSSTLRGCGSGLRRARRF
jgi:NAD(P)-dependent dehydrogenase (short-subunit alcohol dehydrogenase family)